MIKYTVASVFSIYGDSSVRQIYRRNGCFYVKANKSELTFNSDFVLFDGVVYSEVVKFGDIWLSLCTYY